LLQAGSGPEEEGADTIFVTVRVAEPLQARLSGDA